MLESLADVLVSVAGLFVGQLDVQSHAGRFAVERAFVDRFHNAGPAARDDREARVGK